jgi:hypothetical protein
LAEFGGHGVIAFNASTFAVRMLPEAVVMAVPGFAFHLATNARPILGVRISNAQALGAGGFGFLKHHFSLVVALYRAVFGVPFHWALTSSNSKFAISITSYSIPYFIISRFWLTAGKPSFGR